MLIVGQPRLSAATLPVCQTLSGKGVLGSWAVIFVREDEVFFDTLADAVTNTAERAQTLLVRPLRAGRVLEGPVQPSLGSREVRARLVRVVADRDHVVEGLFQVPIQGFGLLPGDVYIDLL